MNDPDIQAPGWSGRNTFKAREDGGASLAKVVESISSNRPIAIICHSHGGSVVAYGFKNYPAAFRQVRTVVCLATPFFGFSVRPGYQALLLTTLVSTLFLLFQSLLFVLLASITEHFPNFAEQPYGMIVTGLTLLAVVAAVGTVVWNRRLHLFRSFERIRMRAAEWDTTQVSLPNPLFVRSMGDEVGLGLSSLQFAATVLNKTLNILSRGLSSVFARVRAIVIRPHGAVAALVLAVLLVTASGLPAVMAATFGYHPRNWIDILYPWSRSFSFFEPEFGTADHVARAIYAFALLALAIAYASMFATAALTLSAVVLSWITTAAFGCLSLRLAIAAEWAVEPMPEGLHSFLNCGWSRNVDLLRDDRSTLQHSEPYSSDSTLASIVRHIENCLAPEAQHSASTSLSRGAASVPPAS